MPRAILSEYAQEDLSLFAADLRRLAISMILTLENHPELGRPTPIEQNLIDFAQEGRLLPPCKFWSQIKLPWRVYVYFNVVGNELHVYQIRAALNL